jgi:endonuclease YncB( thermonuclease family)
MRDRERLRDMIQAELAKRRPRESARASLELLAETSLVIEPGSEEGAQAGKEVWSEDAVRRAVEEVHRSHPRLFLADEAAEAAPNDQRADGTAALAKPERDWLTLDAGDDTSSRRAEAGPGGVASAGVVRGVRLVSYGERVKELGSVLARRVREFRDRSANGGSAARAIAVRPERTTPPSRYVYAALAALLALSVLAWLWPNSKPKLGPGERAVAERAREPRPPREPNETSSVSAQPAGASRTTPPPADEPPGMLRGVPEVIDTATIRLDGKVVRLFGVEWARGGQPEDLAGYLRGREVECELASAPDRYRCQVGGHDLSRAVLFNGGGRATADASPELIAAEGHAKTARRGVWR